MLGELGHGGMAVVYRARHPTLQRDVALKVLHPHLATDPESRARFRREAIAAARLKHPNIVEVYDFADEEAAENFMVSEILEGPTLRSFADANPGIPPEIVAAIGMVLCDALVCAHGQGVIHRDVKPDNIMLHTGGKLKLTDFGIAFVADAHGMTVTGQVLGSPAHMAPEQIEGRKDIDARADIFAAGTVLYVLAVGRLPFEAPQAFALLRKILEAEYPDPLRAAPTIGHRLAEIIRKCLQREPEKRWQSATELRAALAAFIADVGWERPEVPLENYFADPAAFTASHRTTLVARLPDLGMKARRDGRVGDALGYFNRALAIEPTNTRVLAMVRGISRRRQARRAATTAGIIALAAALTGVVVVTAGPRVRAWMRAGRSAAPDVRPEASRARGAVPGAIAGAPNGATTMTTATGGVTDAGTSAAGDGGSRGTGATATSTATGTASGATTIAGGAHATNGGGATSGARDPSVRAGTSTAAHNGANGNGAHVANAARAAGATQTRVVRLVPTPQSVEFSVDRGALRPWSGSAPPLELPLGPHEFRVVSPDPMCQQFVRSVDVEAGEGTQLIRVSLNCGSENRQVRTSSIADGGSRDGPH